MERHISGAGVNPKKPFFAEKSHKTALLLHREPALA
jgi:hypothetical protein